MSNRALIRIIILGALFVIVLLIRIGYAAGPIRAINWEEPTTYVDGTTIISPDNGVIVLPLTYDMHIDNNILPNCNNVQGTSCTFEQWDYGVQHIYGGRTRTADGRVSDWTPAYIWISPLDNTVQPPITVPGIPAIGPIRRP